MVSFQCDACQDVVKKPKLDAHSYKCSASFTCVDCSKTFRTQSEWKVHTSCISEAEKYQKGLYKGKKPQKNGSSQQQNDHHDKSQQSGNDVTRNSNIEQQGPTLGSAAGNSEPVKSEAPISDATDTLVSHITATSAAPDKESRKAKKKRKADRSHAAPKDDTPANGTSQKKKQKLDATDDFGKTERDAVAEEKPMKKDEISVMDPALQGSETGATKKDKKRKKKRGKAKKDKMDSIEEVGTVETGAPPATDSLAPASNPTKENDKSEPKKEEERKSNDDKANSPINEASSSPEDRPEGSATEKKKKRDRMKKERKQEQESALDPENDRTVPEAVTSSKKRKRPSREGDEGIETTGPKKAKKGKEKKEKKGKKEKGAAEQETSDA